MGITTLLAILLIVWIFVNMIILGIYEKRIRKLEIRNETLEYELKEIRGVIYK